MTYDGSTNFSKIEYNKSNTVVLISFDIDGLDRKLCPNTGTPVSGGFETEQVFYLFKQVLKSGRKIIGFDLNEVGVNENEWDQNVGARVLYKLSNLLLYSNLTTNEG
jgi:agmatinase